MDRLKTSPPAYVSGDNLSQEVPSDDEFSGDENLHYFASQRLESPDYDDDDSPQSENSSPLSTSPPVVSNNYGDDFSNNYDEQYIFDDEDVYEVTEVLGDDFDTRINMYKIQEYPFSYDKITDSVTVEYQGEPGDPAFFISRNRSRYGYLQEEEFNMTRKQRGFNRATDFAMETGCRVIKDDNGNFVQTQEFIDFLAQSEQGLDLLCQYKYIPSAVHRFERFDGSFGFFKDLTTEGIEPNPGPRDLPRVDKNFLLGLPDALIKQLLNSMIYSIRCAASDGYYSRTKFETAHLAWQYKLISNRKFLIECWYYNELIVKGALWSFWKYQPDEETDYDIEDDPPKKDLTEEGIEPNPGPNKELVAQYKLLSKRRTIERNKLINEKRKLAQTLTLPTTSTFKEDLTIEGIEPNPGPLTIMKIQQSKFEQKMKAPFTEIQQINHQFFADAMRYEMVDLDMYMHQYSVHINLKNSEQWTEVITLMLMEVKYIMKSASQMYIYNVPLCKVQPGMYKHSLIDAIHKWTQLLDCLVMHIRALPIEAQMMNALSGPAKLADTVKHATDKFEPIGHSISEEMRKFNKNVSSLTDSFKSVVSHTPKSFYKTIAAAVAFFSTLAACIMTNEKNVRYLLIASLAGQVSALYVDSIARFITFLHRKINVVKLPDKFDFIGPQDPLPEEEIEQPESFDVNDIEAQAFGDKVEENGFAAMFEVFKHMCQATDVETKMMDMKRIALFRSYASAIKTVKDFFTFFFKFFQASLEEIYESITGVPYGADQETIELYDDLSSWLLDVGQIASKDKIHHIRQSTFRSSVIIAYTKGLMLSKRLEEKQLTNSRQLLFSRALTQIKELFEAVKDYCATETSRNRPTIIMLKGPTGVGKTNFIEFLTNVLCTVFDWDYTQNVKYPHNPASEYHDGYFHQPFYIMDDPFQNEDKAIMTNVYQTILQMGNEATFPLNMAKAEDKGKVFFDSPVIIITTNYFSAKGTSNFKTPEAIERRFDFVYEVTKANVTTTDWTTDRYELKLLNPEQTYIIDDPSIMKTIPVTSFEDAATAIAARINHYNTSGSNVSKFLKKTHMMDPMADRIKNKVFAQMKHFRKFVGMETPNEVINNIIPIGKTEIQDEAAKMLHELKNLGVEVELPKVPLVPESTPATVAPETEQVPWKKAFLRVKRFVKENQVKFAMQQSHDWMKNARVTMLAAGIGVVAVILGIVGIVKALGKEEDVELQGGALGEYKHKQELIRLGKHPVQTRKNPALQKHVVTQALDLSARNLIDVILPKSLCTFRIDNFETQGIFVYGRTFITVYHIVWSQLKKESYVTIYYRGVEYEVQVDQLDILEQEGEDQCYITITNPQFPQAPDISHHFIKLKEIEIAWNSSISLAIHSKGKLIERYSEKPPRQCGAIKYPDEKNRMYENTSSFYVALPTANGDCGSPYVANNTQLVGKILGIHIAGAGSGDKAVGSVVTYEDILEHKKLTNIATQSGAANFCEISKDLSQSVLNVEGLRSPNVEFIGVVPNKFTPRQPSKHAREPSPFHNMWHKTDFLPSMLRPRDGVSPMQVGLEKKLKRELNTHTDDYLRLACDFIVSKMKHKVPARVLTRDEALNGVPGWKYIKSIDTKTSPGWPENIAPGKKKGKLSCLIGAPGTWKLRKDLDDILTSNIHHHSLGELVEPVMCDNIKDEELPSRKVQNPDGTPVGNSRIMSSGPLPILVEEKMYFGAFFENLLRSHADDDSFCDMGIDASRHEPFYRRYMKLCKRVPEGKTWQEMRTAAGDFEKQDATEMAELSKAVRYIIIEWYRAGGIATEEELKVMETLDLDLSHVVHLAINLLYKTWGNPSGRFLTTVKNSIITLLMFLLTGLHTYMKKFPDSTRSINDIFDHIYEGFTDFGDDHLYAFTEDDWFDMFDIRDECLKWGLIYTSCFKDQPLVASYRFDEVKYLQRYFKFSKGVVHAALDKAIIEDIVYWRAKDQPLERAMNQAVDSALREAFHWGPQYFQMLKKRYNEALRDEGLNISYLTYEEVSGEFFGLAQVVVHAQSGQVSLSEKREVDNPVETVVATTNFADNVGKNDPKSETPATFSSALVGLDPYPDQGLRTVLERPYPVATFSWSSTVPEETALTDFDFPRLLYNVSNIREKLNRFQYLQAGVRVSFRINATMFHSGKLQISWIPHYKRDNGIVNAFQNIYTASALNTLILSANTTVPVDFIIPYVAPSAYWNMKDDPSTIAKGFFGSVAVHVLAPLVLVGTSTPTSLTVQVYANLVDPRVAGLGLRNSLVAPPPALTLKKFRPHSKEGKQEEDVKIVAQMKEQNVRSSDNTISSKAQTKSPSPFTQIIKDLASPLVDMASEFIGSGLGFLNKPTSTQAVQKFTPKNVTTFANVSGLDGVEKLSADPENHVSTDHSIYNQQQDYNKFSEYKLLPGLVEIGKWDSTKAIGFKIIQKGLTPTICKETGVGPVYYFLTPLAHLSSYFAFWRGGMKIHLMFTCSKYTTARIRVTWLPDPTFTAAIIPDEEGDTVNKIVDITGDTSVSFVIPYLKDTQWTEVVTPDKANYQPVTQWLGFNGQLIVTVVNPVSQSTVVADTNIYYAMYVSGAEDFEVSRMSPLWNGYSDGTILPASLTELQNEENKVAKERKERLERSLHAQSGNVTTTVDVRALFRTNFEALIPAKTTVPVGIHMGEKVESWPELLKRYSFHDLQIMSSASLEDNTYNFMRLNINQMEKHQRIRRAFNFERGSYRIKATVQNLNTTTALNRYNLYAANVTDSELGNLGTYSRFPDEGLAIIDTLTNRWLEVEVPYYSKYAMYHTNTDLEDESYPQLKIGTLETLVPSSVWLYLYFSVGDDYTLGHPLAPVPLVTES